MSATVIFNSTIISKLSWMSRQLRKIDDVNALANWVNMMHSIKALLFPLPSDFCCLGTANHRTPENPNSPVSSSYRKPTLNPQHTATDPTPSRRIQMISHLSTLQRSTSHLLNWIHPSKEKRNEHPDQSVHPRCASLPY